MLEHAEYVGNYYGTPRQPVEDWMDQGHDVVLEIEVKGGAQVKQLMPECVSIFILPPSMKVLEKRLRGRGTEDEETIQKRLAKARRKSPTPRTTTTSSTTTPWRTLSATCGPLSRRRN